MISGMVDIKAAGFNFSPNKPIIYLHENDCKDNVSPDVSPKCESELHLG